MANDTGDTATKALLIVSSFLLSAAGPLPRAPTVSDLSYTTCILEFVYAGQKALHPGSACWLPSGKWTVNWDAMYEMRVMYNDASKQDKPLPAPTPGVLTTSVYDRVARRNEDWTLVELNALISAHEAGKLWETSQGKGQ